MLESTEDERLQFPSSENTSLKVSTCLTPELGLLANLAVDIRELKLLSEFSHPNIVKFVSCV